MEQSRRPAAHPPEPPELPEGVAPRWPPGTRASGFLVALIGTLIAVGIVAAATGADDGRGQPDLHGRRHADPEPDLRRHGRAVRLLHAQAGAVALRPAARALLAGGRLGGARAGLLLPFAAVYTALVQPDAEQTVAQDLGADEGTFGLIAAGLHGRVRGARSRRSSSSAASSTGRCAAASRCSPPRDRRRAVRAHPLRLLGRRRAADPAAARRARLHVLPGLREDGLALPGDRAARASTTRSRSASRPRDGEVSARGRPADARSPACSLPRLLRAGPDRATRPDPRGRTHGIVAPHEPPRCLPRRRCSRSPLRPRAAQAQVPAARPRAAASRPGRGRRGLDLRSRGLATQEAALLCALPAGRGARPGQARTSPARR